MDILQPMFGMIALTAVVTLLLYGSRMLLIYRVTTSGVILLEQNMLMRLDRIHLWRSAILRITTTICLSSLRSFMRWLSISSWPAYGQYPRPACLDIRRI